MKHNCLTVLDFKHTLGITNITTAFFNVCVYIYKQYRIGIPNDELPVRGSTGYNVCVYIYKQYRIGIPNDELPVRGSTGYNVST